MRKKARAFATGLPSTYACLSRRREAGARGRSSAPSPTSQAGLTRYDGLSQFRRLPRKRAMCGKLLRCRTWCLAIRQAPRVCRHATDLRCRPRRIHQRRSQNKSVGGRASQGKPVSPGTSRGLKIGATLTWSHSQFGPASVFLYTGVVGKNKPVSPPAPVCLPGRLPNMGSDRDRGAAPAERPP